MDDRPAVELIEQANEKSESCEKRFLLRDLIPGETDKLGHIVEEILWIGQDYKVYRSRKGIYVHFSDCRDVETAQRKRFTEISPELCELRYLTDQMSSSASLYYHNMAQAVMLAMENKAAEGRRIAEQAQKMAIQRVTNDHTVRYFACCVVCWSLAMSVCGVFLWQGAISKQWIVAAMAGATGALLSVATRLQTFQFKPCHQSSMNYVMSCSRVGVGLLGGVILLLLSTTILKDQINSLMDGLKGVVIVGLIGGFGERLVPNILTKTIGQIENSAGTPVQAARQEAIENNGTLKPAAV